MSLFYVVPARQDRGIRRYLETDGRRCAVAMQVVHYEDLPERRTFEPGAYILSALDQLGPGLLELVAEIRRRLGDRAGFRFLNDPECTLPRRALLEELYRRGLNDFRVFPADGDLSGVRFPAFLRVERTHGGSLSPLLRSIRELEAALGRAVLRGHRVRDLLVVEFCPTAGEDGRYRKYAAFNVDGRIVPQHISCGRDWMQKYEGTDSDPEILQEELDYVQDNPHRERLAEIFAIGRVEYGRIDYSLRDGRVQTWEINQHPVIILANPVPGRGAKRDIFHRNLQDAFAALNGRTETGPGVPLELGSGAITDARAESIRRTSVRDRALRILEPVRPVIEPLVRPALPWLGRLARRRARRP